MNELILRTFIPIQPQGKARPKIVRRANSPFPVAITPDKTVHAEQAIRWHVQQVWGERPPLDEALVVEIGAVFIKPKSKSSKVTMQTTKPDWDNIGKLVCDSLNGLLWIDDARIMDGRVTKVYGATAGILLQVFRPVGA